MRGCAGYDAARLEGGGYAEGFGALGLFAGAVEVGCGGGGGGGGGGDGEEGEERGGGGGEEEAGAAGGDGEGVVVKGVVGAGEAVVGFEVGGVEGEGGGAVVGARAVVLWRSRGMSIGFVLLCYGKVIMRGRQGKWPDINNHCRVHTQF